MTNSDHIMEKLFSGLERSLKATHTEACLQRILSGESRSTPPRLVTQEDNIHLAMELQCTCNQEMPDWDSGGRIHNWHNHVPEQFRATWLQYSQQTREALQDWAIDLANKEEWD